MKLNDITVRANRCSVEWCSKPLWARGFCGTHYAYWRTHGYIKKTRQQMTLEEKLLSKRQITDNGCWVWTGGCHERGYGVTSFKGQEIRVTRASLFIWKGFDLNSKLKALHTCDNPPCFNPDHLFAGTMLENTWDMIHKGRSSAIGKISDHMARRIILMRELGTPWNKIASLFNVRMASVWQAAKRPRLQTSK